MAPLSEQARERVEALFSYEFKNPHLLTEALHAAGPTTILGRPIIDGNKNLAIIGDSVIKTVLVVDSWKLGMTKGASTQRTGNTQSNANLDILGRAQGLDKFLVLNAGMSAVSPYMMATGVEAVFGAVYVDSGLDIEVVRTGMLNMGLLSDRPEPSASAWLL